MPSTVHEKYREIVDAQPRCEDAWFPDALRRAQAGDEAAIREISGALLRVALEMAETASQRNESLEVMDLVQEANAALVRAIGEFRGATFGDLLGHVRPAIETRLNELANPRPPAAP